MPDSARDIALQCSPFLAAMDARHPDWLPGLKAAGRLDQDLSPDPAELAVLIAQHGTDAGLRLFRNREMMRITWRELQREARLEDTMMDLSLLAEHCLQAAIDIHHLELSERLGTPRNRDGEESLLVVLGMGKLGGYELNLSSDIDLVFTFSEGGECDGRRRLSNDQFFIRLVRKVINSLSEINEHGFCFRVDTRLRPFGESGPLVCSFGAMEQYYQREGRDWERYALVKARPVAGDRPAGDDLLSRLKPFIYRRYIDFGAVEALHEMYQSLREDATRNDRGGDVKRGPGGIREVEFLVQAFQLLRGGREPRLQTTSLMTALTILPALGMLDTGTVENLKEHYRFLRHLENAIQALHDRQTHNLPGGEDLQRVARAMRFTASGELLEALESVRNGVLACIEQSFPEQAPVAPADSTRRRWSELRAGDWTGQSTSDDPVEVFMTSLARLKLSQRASGRLDRFMPVLFDQLDGLGIDDAVLTDTLNLVLAICRRSAYLSLLLHNPAALTRMLTLFSASDWLARTVIRHPALLDELIDPALGKQLPDREEMEGTARRILSSSDDTEAALQGLNHMKRAFSLRIGVAELESTLTARAAQLSLTALAETMVGSCLELATGEVRTRNGTLPGEGLAVIGYGSLGAAELGYRSDLDLIFLYPQSDERSDGKRPLEAERYHTAIVRRLLSYLVATTTSGRLYEVDTRLRPNGRSGLLVSSLQAFGKYQKEDAWTWELQALCRARPCAGSTAIWERFMVLRKEILAQPREPDSTREQVVKMREKMRQAHPDRHGFKHAPGGLVDIDFVAQLGLLICAHDHQQVLDAVGTRDQLRTLSGCGWQDQARFDELLTAIDALTRARHLSLLSRNPPAEELPTERWAQICRAILAQGH